MVNMSNADACRLIRLLDKSASAVGKTKVSEAEHARQLRLMSKKLKKKLYGTLSI